LISFFIVLLSSLPVFAQVGGVSISPQRVVFEGRQRTAEVTLMNRGAEATTYRVFFENLRMEQDGQYTTIEEPDQGQLFADGLIRYSPRQVTIPAGGSQTVRLMVRKTKGLKPAEYRSHLYFMSLPPKDSGLDLETTDLKEGELSVKMIATYAISIPIIVRHGKLTAGLTISDLNLTLPKTEAEKPRLSVKLNRQGERSVYGNITINFKPKSGGDPIEVGRLNGVSVFTPNKSRVLNINLYPPEGINLKNGTLNITYDEDLKKGESVFAQERLMIN